MLPGRCAGSCRSGRTSRCRCWRTCSPTRCCRRPRCPATTRGRRSAPRAPSVRVWGAAPSAAPPAAGAHPAPPRSAQTAARPPPQTCWSSFRGSSRRARTGLTWGPAQHRRCRCRRCRRQRQAAAQRRRRRRRRRRRPRAEHTQPPAARAAALGGAADASPQASVAAPCSSGDSTAAGARSAARAAAAASPNKRPRSGEECSSTDSAAAYVRAHAASLGGGRLAAAAACGGAASAAPGGGGSGDAEESEEAKRAARMARNRESALHSRQRKKMQADELERRCDALQADNRRLTGAAPRPVVLRLLCAVVRDVPDAPWCRGGRGSDHCSTQAQSLSCVPCWLARMRKSALGRPPCLAAATRVR